MTRSFLVGRRVGALCAPFVLALCSGCVLTTFEGAGEPPRIAPPPNPILPEGKTARSSKPSATLSLDAAAPEEIGARHLLVSYKGALNAPPGIGRSKEEARARAEEAEKKAKAGEDFVTLVKQYSDEPGAGDRGGDLGVFDHQAMVPAFANAAFALKVNEISSVVETQFGFHVILRTK